MSESKNIEMIIKLLEPIINKQLLQTHSKYREDLKQEIILGIINKLKSEDFMAPVFFEFIEQTKSTNK